MESVDVGGVAGASDTSWFDSDELLSQASNVCVGVLPNGLRVVLCANEYPPNRVSAHLEVHAGSLHEGPTEQGLAHLLEHCVFTSTTAFPDVHQLKDELARLGMSFGGDSNAYTVFRSTVYTLEAPVRLQADDDDDDGTAADGTRDGDSVEDDDQGDDDDDGKQDYDAMDDGEDGEDDAAATEEAMDVDACESGDTGSDAAADAALSRTTLPQLLFLLHQFTRCATLTHPSVDTERLSVLSEASMRGGVDYRLDAALTGQVHAETKLPRRMPIGLVEVVQTATREEMRAFYTRWYTPHNMTLYVVGPIPSMPALMRCVQRTFAPEHPLTAAPRLLGPTEVLPPNPNTAETLPHVFDRPPTEPLVIVQHPLLHAFCFMLTWKVPLHWFHTQTKGEFATAVLDIVLSYVLEERVSALKQRCAHPCFSGIAWDDSSVAEEGCGLRSIAISADSLVAADDDDDGFGPYTSAQPAWAGHAWIDGRGSKWQRALTTGFRESLRLVRYGVLEKELRLACAVFLKELRDRVTTAASIENDDILEELQSGVHTASTPLSPEQEFQYASELMLSITVARANARLKEVLGFVEDAAADAVRVMETRDSDGESAVASAASEMMFQDANRAVSIFVAAPGAVDTLSGITAAAQAACVAELPRAAAILDDSLVPAALPVVRTSSALTAGSAMSQDTHDHASTPGLYDRLRKKKTRLARVVSGDGEGDDEAAGPPGVHRHVEGVAPITPLQVIAALAHATLQLAPPVDLDIPDTLIAPGAVAAKAELAVAEHVRRGVPYGFIDLHTHDQTATMAFQSVGSCDVEVLPPTAPHRLVDAVTGICMLRCSNGLTVSYRPSRFEPNQVSMSVMCRLGRGTEGPTGWTWGSHPESSTLSGTLAAGLTYGVPAWSRPPYPAGSLSIAVSTLANGGIGSLSADVLNRLGMLWGLSYSMTAMADYLLINVTTTTSDDGLHKAMQLVHLILTEPRWEAAAHSRTMDAWIADSQHLVRDLDRKTDWALEHASTASDPRVCLPNFAEDASARVDLETCRALFAEMLVPGNTQLVVSGDFQHEELEALLARYLLPIPMPVVSERPLRNREASQAISVGEGVVRASPLLLPSASSTLRWSQPLADLPVRVTGQVVRTDDDEARFVLTWMMPAAGKYPLLLRNPARYAFSATPAVTAATQGPGSYAANRQHSLFHYRCMSVLIDVLNERLFKALRDDTGLCYAVSYAERRGSEHTHPGTGTGNATAVPANGPTVFAKALQVMHAALSGAEPVTESEFKRAHAPLVQSIRAMARTTAYWHALGMFVHALGSGKHMANLHGILEFFESLTVEDVRAAVDELAALLPSPLPIHVCIGVSGDAPFLHAADGMPLDDAQAWERLLELSTAAAAVST